MKQYEADHVLDEKQALFDKKENINLLLEALEEGTILKRKCYFVQFLLSSAFGPLGLLYSSVTATLVMIAVTLFIIIMANTSYTDAPAILYYGTAYVIIVIANAISVLVGFFTVNNYNNQQIGKHIKFLKLISYSSCGLEILKKDLEKNGEVLDNLAPTTLGTGVRLLIIGLILLAIVMGYQMNKMSESVKTTTYEETMQEKSNYYDSQSEQ